MKIKKFEAPSMKEALEKIKEEMGPDAFILNTKQIAKKGPLGFGDRKFLQVTAAIEEDGLGASNLSQMAETLKAGPEKANQTTDRAGKPTATVTRAKAAAPKSGPANRSGLSSTALDNDILDPVPTYNARGKTASPKATPSPLGFGSSSSFTEGFEAVFAEARTIPPVNLNEPTPKAPKEGNRPLREELSELKDMVQDLGSHSPDLSPLQKDLGELKGLLYNVIRNQSPVYGRSLSPALLHVMQRLKDSGFDETIAEKMIQIADEKLASSDKDDPQKVYRYMQTLIRQSVEAAKPMRLGGDHPKIIAFVGPTGVGKTTTLAKLAAYTALQIHAKVVLITLDTYRIAAVEQLTKYAKIMEIPVQVALNLNELRQAIQFHQDKSLILIDTAGHSPKDQVSMDNLGEFLQDQHDIEVHLVLSATTKAADLKDIVARFEHLNPQFLTFTKIDETSTYGALFTQLVKTKKPVSYVTTGQSVPEDFEFATKALLADLFIGKSLEQIKEGNS